MIDYNALINANFSRFILILYKNSKVQTKLLPTGRQAKPKIQSKLIVFLNIEI